jgi:hypothetical protein
MLFAEYGARVKFDERYEYPMPGGTIVNTICVWDVAGDEYEPVYVIRRDFDGQEGNYTTEVFTVVMTPTDAAQRMTDKWTVDQCLEAAETLATVSTSRGLEIYQAALIVEFYKVHAYAEDSDVIRYDRGGWISGPTGWDKV